MANNESVTKRVAVYELAKELKLDSRRLIDLLHRLQVEGIRNHMSPVPLEAVEAVRRIMQGGLPPLKVKKRQNDAPASVHRPIKLKSLRKTVNALEMVLHQLGKTLRQDQLCFLNKLNVSCRTVDGIVSMYTSNPSQDGPVLWNRMLSLRDLFVDQRKKLESEWLFPPITSAETLLSSLSEISGLQRLEYIGEIRKVFEQLSDRFNCLRDMSGGDPLKVKIRALLRNLREILDQLEPHHRLAPYVPLILTASTVQDCLQLTDTSPLLRETLWNAYYEAGRVYCDAWAGLERRHKIDALLATTSDDSWVDSSTISAMSAIQQTYEHPSLLAQAAIDILDTSAPPIELLEFPAQIGLSSDLFTKAALAIPVETLPFENQWDRAVLARFRMRYYGRPSVASRSTQPEPRYNQRVMSDLRVAMEHYQSPVLQPEERAHLNDVYHKSLVALEHSTKTPPLEGWRSPIVYSYLGNLGWLSYQVTAEHHAWGRFHIWTDHGELDFVLNEYIEPRNDNELIVLTWAFSVLEGLRCEHTKLTPEGYRPHRRKLQLHKIGTHSPKARHRFKNSSRPMLRHANESRYMKAHLSSPTLVRGHTMDLKGLKHPKPRQLELAQLYRIHVEPGHTFCRPHIRGATKPGLQWHISWDTNAIIHELPDIARPRDKASHL